MPLAAAIDGRMELRLLHRAAHQDFDRLWANDVPGVTLGHKITNRCRNALHRQWPKRRSAAYAWLADRLGLPAWRCSLGLFDAATLERVIALSRAATPEEIRVFEAGREAA